MVGIGDTVEFYDCMRAWKDKNHSGDKKYYSIGIVIDRRITDKLVVADIELGGDDVVDIKLPDGRISESHFTRCVKVIK